MYIKSYIARLGILLGTSFLVSCSNKEDIRISDGKLTHDYIQSLSGFEEEKGLLISEANITEDIFCRISTDSAWSLPVTDQTALTNIRNGVSRPDEKTMLQKIISLEDISTYMNNIYGGTIGGFVSEAADVKSLSTMEEIFKGLRLDYEGTKFKINGAGYAVIRFYSTSTSKMRIPYSPELGGTQEHSWPNGGGGFTTSTLGRGGYPEWVFDGYNAPEEGAELYEVTPMGREILRSVYNNNKWQTYESEYYPLPESKSSEVSQYSKQIRNGQYSDGFVTTLGEYRGYTFIIRGEINGNYHLTAQTHYPITGLQVKEKGIYGIEVPFKEVSNVRELIK